MVSLGLCSCFSLPHTHIVADVEFFSASKKVHAAVSPSHVKILVTTFVELVTSGEDAEKARQLGPVYERDVFGKKVMTFEGVDRASLEGLGEAHTPSVADLFVAKVKGAAA